MNAVLRDKEAIICVTGDRFDKRRYFGEWAIVWKMSDLVARVYRFENGDYFVKVKGRSRCKSVSF